MYLYHVFYKVFLEQTQEWYAVLISRVQVVVDNRGVFMHDPIRMATNNDE